MLDNDATRDARNPAQGTDAFAIPGFALNMWNPALACSTEWNAKLHEGFVALSTEWQDFVSRRMQDDLSLLQQVGSSQSPEQAWTAYVAFWRKAAEDYAREFAMLSKLTGDLVSSSVAAVQHGMAAPNVAKVA